MNVNKHGIPRAEKHNRIQLGKPYRAVANPHKHYITLFRKEDNVPVWLVMPIDWKEVKQLKKEGWHIIEIWEKQT